MSLGLSGMSIISSFIGMLMKFSIESLKSISIPLVNTCISRSSWVKVEKHGPQNPVIHLDVKNSWTQPDL